MGLEEKEEFGDKKVKEKNRNGNGFCFKNGEIGIPMLRLSYS